VLVTRRPSSVRPRHLAVLRKQGLTDRDILDAVQVISYFNYINRIADALGVDLEREMLAAFQRRKRTGR
jgi:alkylhydroperoxidase family enzyme